MRSLPHLATGSLSALLSLLSCAACPMCVPIYAGILSIVGIELVEWHAYFFPYMLVSFVISLGLMAYQSFYYSKDKRPFLMGLIAAIFVILSAKWGFEPGLYGALALFMAALFWNKHVIKSHTHSKECC